MVALSQLVCHRYFSPQRNNEHPQWRARWVSCRTRKTWHLDLVAIQTLAAQCPTGVVRDQLLSRKSHDPPSSREAAHGRGHVALIEAISCGTKKSGLDGARLRNFVNTAGTYNPMFSVR